MCEIYPVCKTMYIKGNEKSLLFWVKTILLFHSFINVFLFHFHSVFMPSVSLKLAITFLTVNEPVDIAIIKRNN